MSPLLSWLPALAAGISAGQLVLSSCGARSRPPDETGWEARRAEMVAEQIAARGIEDPRVLAAMRTVERHRFVPERMAALAYDDRPLAIGYEQTISQPYVVAFMSEAAEIGANDRVLEIGTGSGYQAAVLALLAREVYSIEILEPLATDAAERLARLGYDGVHVRHGDGYAGWPGAAPFDVILLTAAPRKIPQPLLDQLAPGGRLVAPIGQTDQDLVRVRRTPTGLEREQLLFVRFVPMTGEAQRH